jgi:hypothetical protein
VVLPFDTNSTEFEHVLIFHCVHSVANIVRDLRLQFADETLKDRHLSAREKPGLLKGADMMRDEMKVLVDAGKGLIRLKLSSKIGSSHLCSSFT